MRIESKALPGPAGSWDLPGGSFTCSRSCSAQRARPENTRKSLQVLTETLQAWMGRIFVERSHGGEMSVKFKEKYFKIILLLPE